MKNTVNKLKENKIAQIVVIAAAVAFITASAIYFGAVKPALAKGNAQVITNEAPAVSLDTREAKKDLDINPFAGRYVTYEGITGGQSKGSTFLVNPEDNGEDIFIEFVVSENENILYSSELVPSGQGLDVDFGNFLSEGEHEVIVSMNPYLLYEGEYLRCPVNNAQSIKVNI